MIKNDLLLILPEILLFSVTCVLLIVSLFISSQWRHKFIFLGSQLGIFLSFIALVQTAGANATLLPIFHGHYIVDNLAYLLKLAILLISFVALIYAYYGIAEKTIEYIEYYILCLFSILGMMVLVSAGSFLVLYLGVELLSLPLYALVAFDKNTSIGSEAAMKYFILGALASGILLYGMSLIYGVTQTIELTAIASAIANHLNEYKLIISLGLIFLTVGFAFKLGAAPFHMWIPDVYQGAMTPVTLFLSTAPKIAALGMAIRILTTALPALHLEWQTMLMFIAIASIVLGNVIAISQTNIKRLFAYSGIAHIGFMLVGMVSGTQEGTFASIFYIIVYTITTVGGFGMLVLLNHQGHKVEQLDDLKGLSTNNPWYAFIFMVLIISMAGVPPTLGFYAKFAVFQSVIASGFVKFATIAIIFSVVGAYYYLRVIKFMYFDKANHDNCLQAPIGCTVLASVNSLAVLVLGVLPGLLINFLHAIVN